MNGHEEGRLRRSLAAARKARARAAQRRAEHEKLLDEKLAPIAGMKGQIDELALQEMVDEGGLPAVFEAGFLAALYDLREALGDRIVIDDETLKAWIAFTSAITRNGQET